MAVTWVRFVRCLGEFLNVFRGAELLAQRCLRKNKTTLLLFFQGVSVRPNLVAASLGRGDGAVPVSFPCSPVLGAGMGLAVGLLFLC